MIDRVYATEEARTHATDKAEQLQAKLDPSHPSFVKPMTQSHVTGGFWLVSKRLPLLHVRQY